MQRALVGLAAAVLLTGLWAAFSGPATSQEKPDLAKAVKELRKQSHRTNLTLMSEGKYSCCITPGCAFCTLALGHCPCAGYLAQGKPVCHTCKGGWDAGCGSIPDVDPKSVKAFEGEQLKKVYEDRKKAMKEAR